MMGYLSRVNRGDRKTEWLNTPIDNNPLSRGVRTLCVLSISSKLNTGANPVPGAHSPGNHGACKAGAINIKMDKFIVVNERILDCTLYKKDFALLRKIIQSDLREYFEKLGFETGKIGRGSNVYRRQATFYNKGMDFEVVIVTRKQEKEFFV